MRTLEMFRSAGIEEQVREQSLKEFEPEGAVVLMDTLAGKQLAGLIPSLNEGVEALSPSRRLFVTPAWPRADSATHGPSRQARR